MNNTIDKIRRDYNPEFDYDPSAPPVPWHVAELTEVVDKLLDKVDKLQEELEVLRKRFDAHEFY
jgi:hypothetical protein